MHKIKNYYFISDETNIAFLLSKEYLDIILLSYLQNSFSVDSNH